MLLQKQETVAMCAPERASDRVAAIQRAVQATMLMRRLGR